jgi:hypothetical protein
VNWLRMQKLNCLERRVVNAAKYACSNFETVDEFHDAEQLLIEAVNDLKHFENKKRNQMRAKNESR